MVVGDVDAAVLVSDLTVVSIRGPVVVEVVGATVLEAVVAGNFVDDAVFVDSTVVEGDALMVWEFVICEPVVSATVDVDVTSLVVAILI